MVIDKDKLLEYLDNKIDESKQHKVFAEKRKSHIDATKFKYIIDKVTEIKQHIEEGHLDLIEQEEIKDNEHF